MVERGAIAVVVVIGIALILVLNLFLARGSRRRRAPHITDMEEFGRHRPPDVPI